LARKIIKQNSSFGVLRANPRISGNVKITVDSNKDIWLNSIDSNPEMSNQAYKGFRISPESSFDRDIYTFFNKGQTPSQFVFGLSGEDDPVQNQLNDVSSSYNFIYSSGVTPLVSDKYPEDFSYLAPIWLGDDIPDNFVIFKINDPIDYSYLVPVTTLFTGNSYKVLETPGLDTNDPGYLPFKIQIGTSQYEDGNVFNPQISGNYTVLQGEGTVVILDPLYHLSDVEDTSSHFYNKILPKATVVASFDLTENSKIGKYLRKIKTTPGYSDSLIDVRFEESQLTTFNGVNYSVGIFDKKGDFLFDYFNTPQTQIGFEDFITDGFRRNAVISYKLLNLEFLFNDSDSENYTINRYFGLYVNSPEISSFKLDGDAFFKDGGNSGNTPVPERNDKGYYYQETSYFQYNDKGIRLFIDPKYTQGVLPNSDNINIEEATKLFWIKDKFDNFHSLKRDIDYTNLSPSPFNSTYGLSGTQNQIVIQDTSVDLSIFTGEDKDTRKQYPGSYTGEKGRAHIVIRIAGELTNTNQDAFVFYHPLGSQGTPGLKYDLIKTSDLSSIVDEWGPGSFYSQDNVYYIHPFGTNEDIAKALTGLFNSFNYNSFEAFQSGDEVVIRTIATGSKENTKYYLDFFQDFSILQRIPLSRKGTIFINEKDVYYINQRQSFVGGSNNAANRVKVKIEDLNKIEVGKTFLETVKTTSTDTYANLPQYTNKGLSVVVGKYRFVDQYAKSEGGEIIGLKDFETHGTIEVETKTERISLGSINKINAFETYQIPLGIFSFYGLREIDMDFWESNYGYTPTEEYYKYLDIQPNGVTKVVTGKSYFVSSGSEIIYNSQNITGPDFFEGVFGVDSYELVSGPTGSEANVYPTISSRGNINIGITPTNFDSAFYPDLDAFPGFYGIQALKFINNEVGIETKNSQLNFGKLDSEYDYTNDNYNPDFALKSRVVPYITKWTYRGGTDIRGNDYRLNSNIAFSPLNFSPSFFRRTQDPQYFTHEWLHLQRPPYSLPEENIHKDKSYLASEINETLLNDANPAKRDYFLDYFSIEGEDLVSYYSGSNTIENVNLTERYSVFDFNTGNGLCETLFRGAKIKIKRTFTDYGQGENIRFINDDRFFDAYKFSCVIVPIRNIENKIQPLFKIKVLENRTFKTITFVLELLIDDSRIYNFEDISPENQYLDLDYFLLYSLKDKLSKSYVPLSSPPTPWIPTNSVEIPKVGDIKLSSALNITSVPTSSGFFSAVNNGTVGTEGEIYIIPNPEYETDLRDEINFTYLPSTVPGPTSSTGPGSFYGIVGSTGTGYGYYLPFPTDVKDQIVNFTNTSANYSFDFSDLSIPGPLTIPTIANIGTVKNIPIYQRDGGIGYWNNILEKISFASLSLLVNTGYNFIEYKSYIWNENTKTTDVLDDQFVLEFVRPSAFEQDSIIISEEIENKPQELSLFNIGYSTITANGKSELYRYSGEYVPSFREILKFENVKYDLPFWTTPNLYTFIVKVVDKVSEYEYYDLGSNYCYSINGVPQNKITLIKGVTYLFDLSDSSNTGYQLYFSLSEIGNSISTDSLSEGYTLYGTPGTTGSYIQYNVPYNLESDVYYVSQGGLFMGTEIKVVDSIEYSYCSFGPDKDNFGKVKNVNYYKYSTNWIYRIGKNSPFNPVYNLIGETPVDKRDLSLFESSWDPGFYREYSAPTTYTSLPGTRSMKEQKSFFGSKVMQTPDFVSVQKQIVYPTSLNNVLDLNYDNYPNYEILWENTNTELRGVLLMDRMLIRYFLEDGAIKTFEDFIVPEFGFGSLSDVNDDFNEYMKLNIVPIFQSKNNGSFVRKIPLQQRSVYIPVTGDYANYEKIINGYYPSQDVRYTKVNELRYEFRIPKDPSFNYSLAFSIDIGKI
jgi:hypothetical protein